MSFPVIKGAWGTLSEIINEVPTHLIIGRLPRLLPSSPDMWWLKNQLLNKCNLSWGRVFSGEDSDGVVRVGSQADGLDGKYGTRFSGVDHLGVTDEKEVEERVKELLDGNMQPFSPVGP